MNTRAGTRVLIYSEFYRRRYGATDQIRPSAGMPRPVNPVVTLVDLKGLRGARRRSEVGVIAHELQEKVG